MLRPMDLRTTPEQEELRAAFRAWLVEHLPWPYGVGLPPRFDDLAETVAFGRRWQAALAADGWVGVTWPEDYGGRGLGALENYVVIEELARARAPELVGRIGINLVGPTLLAHGTAAQKERFSRRILAADELWCQLFSEPDAGSDLASLTTRAVPVAGGYRVTGRKVWTSYAQFADWGLCLTRSDPDAPKRQQGITALIVDLHAEGVHVHPLVQSPARPSSTRSSSTTSSYPRSAAIGDEGAGWSVAGSTLAHERGINPRQLVIHTQLIEELLRLAEANGSFDDWRLRQQLAQAATEVRLFHLHNWRSLTRLSKGEAPGPEGSALKLYRSEMSKRLHQTGARRARPGGPAVGRSAGQPRRRRLAARRGSTTRRPPSSPARTRSSARWSASACSACPGVSTRRRRRAGWGRGGEEPMSTHSEGFTAIRYEVDAAVATITMNRPEVANAQDSALIDEIDAALDLADADDAVRVVILAGAGKHFSAGHDLKALVAGDGDDPWVAVRETPEGKFEHEKTMYFERCLRIHDFRKPTIAAVQGSCVAAGLMLAAMCDLIVAADDAVFSNPVLRLTGAGVELLVEPWEIGIRKAKEFLLTGDTIDAQEAWRLGLVNRVVPRAELDAATRELAERIALVPPITAQRSRTP